MFSNQWRSYFGLAATGVIQGHSYLCLSSFPTGQSDRLPLLRDQEASCQLRSRLVSNENHGAEEGLERSALTATTTGTKFNSFRNIKPVFSKPLFILGKTAVLDFSRVAPMLRFFLQQIPLRSAADSTFTFDTSFKLCSLRGTENNSHDPQCIISQVSSKLRPSTNGPAWPRSGERRIT